MIYMNTEQLIYIFHGQVLQETESQVGGDIVNTCVPATV